MPWACCRSPLRLVLIEQVTMGEEDTYTLTGSEYRSDVYDTSGLGLTPQTQTTFHMLPALYSLDTQARYHASYQPMVPGRAHRAHRAVARGVTVSLPGCGGHDL